MFLQKRAFLKIGSFPTTSIIMLQAKDRVAVEQTQGFAPKTYSPYPHY
jgi:hypothetical protein